jgi:hypothetical protein
VRRSQARRRPPPAAYRKSVPCPLCGGGTGVCGRCRGERRVEVFLPLRRLTDEELRVHALQLFDLAFDGLGDVASRSRASADLRASARDASMLLSFALGRQLAFYVAHHARVAAGLAGRVGARDAVRALCELARRAGMAAREGFGFPRPNIDVRSSA